MLWHCFSSQVKQDSERFLAIVRLNLYLKKNLRPILEKYLEEPNIWNTWNKIYLEVKPMLDNLVDEDAMSEYTWMGDQDANSYNDLSVNNEADVRQGKYKSNPENSRISFRCKKSLWVSILTKHPSPYLFRTLTNKIKKNMGAKDKESKKEIPLEYHIP